MWGEEDSDKDCLLLFFPLQWKKRKAGKSIRKEGERPVENANTNENARGWG